MKIIIVSDLYSAQGVSKFAPTVKAVIIPGSNTNFYASSPTFITKNHILILNQFHSLREGLGEKLKEQGIKFEVVKNLEEVKKLLELE